MASVLRLAPAGTGKTQTMLSLLRQDVRQGDRLPPRIWMLLATRRQELYFRERLALDDDRQRVHFHIDFFNFYRLNAHLLRLARAPARRLNETARFSFLRRLLQDMREADELRVFHNIADMRGFVTTLAQLFDELKQSGINAKIYNEAAQNHKDRELAAIYARYQQRLREHRLADTEGEGWLALATLQEQPQIVAGVKWLLVDGFDQFTRLQAQLLAVLAKTVPQLRISLTQAPAAPPTSRSCIARQRLEGAFARAGVSLEIEKIVPQLQRPAGLQRLSQHFYAGSEGGGSSAAIKLIAAPNPAHEAREVLRDVKRLLLDGAAPDDVLIILRDWELYAEGLQTVSEEFQLPLLMQIERPGSHAPAIAALLAVLGLSPRFRRRDLLDGLRSPYIDSGLDDEWIDLLDRISRERQIVGGSKREWLEVIRRASQPKPASSEESGTMLSQAQADALGKKLSAFMDCLTPPAQAGPRAYVRWLDGILGEDPHEQSEAETRHNSGYSLHVRKLARADDNAHSQRDSRALSSLDASLRDLLATDDALRQIGRQRQISWAQFLGDLRHALDSPLWPQGNQPRRGKALVTIASQARGLPHKHVYILGLSEGVFPAEAREEPFYLDSERAAMRARGISLDSRAERSDDTGLFYELLALPQRTLVLSRPAFKAGKPWLESQLWRAVRRIYPQQPIHKRSLGEIANSSEAASCDELMLALARALPQPESWTANKTLRHLNWLRAEMPAAWQHIKIGRTVELGRLSNQPANHYSGSLANPELLAEVARLLGRQRVWSASQLKDYGVCGFRFFAKRLLKLDELKEAQPGADLRQMGSLRHRILEEAYRRIADEDLAVSSSSRERALAIFDEVADDLLERAPELFNFRAGSAWDGEKQLIRARLAALVRQDFSDEAPLQAFGGSRHIERLEHEFADLEVALGGGDSLRARGIIDRIDRVDGKLALVDYKTGSTAIPHSEMETGRDFQMLLYLLALDDMARGAGADVAGGLFWHLRNLKVSGRVHSEDEEHQEMLEKARRHIASNLQQARAGIFPVQPTALDHGKCVRYCEFAHLCRRSNTSRFKNRRA
ncbi:MAG: exodeoxyribonuclease V subunit gamma [Chloroflexi bacterium]|nr:exodeoxyribonuclease V subunit gamma [Chloroflexota bacterium]MCY4247666.1 exodeoxyribonuclease V subunit gamma [Chloroflexota bacterium]